MRAEKRRLAIIMGIIALLLLCAVVPAFALLIHDTNIDFNTKFGDIPADATNFSAQSHQTFIFSRAGETHDINLTVSNKANAPMQYSYEISVNDNSQGLENAILVYMDNKFVSTLASAKSNAIEVLSEDYILKAKVGNQTDSVNHKLSFELHNGADGSVYQNKQFEVTVTLKAKNINFQKNLIVSNVEQFSNALSDVQYSDSLITLRLNGDIDLAEDITLTKACNIDLMGHRLNFNGKYLNLSFTESGVAKIYSSRGEVENTLTYGIKLLSDKTALVFGSGAYSFSQAVAVGLCDIQAANELMFQNLTENIGFGVKAAESINFAQGLTHYTLSGKVSVLKQYGNYNISQNKIIAAAAQRTDMCALTVGGNVLVFKILGQDADGYAAIINDKFAYLNLLTIDKSDTEVDFDLFLPTRFEDVNASITWQSLNPNILSDKGICGDSVEGIATLIATIDINNTTISKAFTFSILKQTNQMRFDYLVARIGEQNLSALYDASMPNGSYFVLPIVEQGNQEDYRAMYSMRSLGLESLTYELSPTFNYLSTLGVANRVHLVEPTLETYAEVLIKGKFSNEREKEYISTIGVQIKTLDNTKLHQQILDYLQTLLNDVDILQNVLDTRAQSGMANERGDFTLPSEYKGFDIMFTSLDPLFKTIEYLAPTELEEGKALFKLDLSKLAAKTGSAIIQASIRIKGATESSLTTSSPLKVVTPAAIVMAAEGIDEIGLFNTLKLQTIQQLVNFDGTLQSGVPTINSNADTVQKLLNGYILLRDIQFVKKFIIRTGDYTYGSSLNLHDYDADTKLYFYSVNDLSFVYAGLGMLNSLTHLKINNDAQLFKGSDTAKSQLSGAMLDMIGSEYLLLEHLEMTNSYLLAATQTLKLNKLTYLDLKGNSLIGNMDFLCDRSNNILNYLDISGTAYDYTADYGVLFALHYKHTILGSANNQQLYYTYNGLRTLFENTETASGLEAYFCIYTLSQGKDMITSISMQLKWDIQSATLGLLNITWTLMSGNNHAGLSIGEIVINYTSSKVKLSNNLLGTAKPSDGRQFENCNLQASISFTDRQTTAIKSINRTFKLKLAY